MTDTWRLIIDGPVDGALNMALDRAAQLARASDAVPPTLRLYRWARPTATLGRFQDPGAVDASVCRSAGVDVVRRFTGGRGVLHDDEVTYSVIASVDDGIPRGVAKSYRHLCTALADAYVALGVRAAVTEHDTVSAPSHACYLATTRADLSLDGRKLSGSAQVWSGTTVLQHGSLVRTRDSALEARVFGLTEKERARLDSEVVAMAAAVTPVPRVEEIQQAVTRAFEGTLGIALRVGGWTAMEAGLAAELLDEARVG